MVFFKEYGNLVDSYLTKDIAGYETENIYWKYYMLYNTKKSIGVVVGHHKDHNYSIPNGTDEENYEYITFLIDDKSNVSDTSLIESFYFKEKYVISKEYCNVPIDLAIKFYAENIVDNPELKTKLLDSLENHCIVCGATLKYSNICWGCEKGI